MFNEEYEFRRDNYRAILSRRRFFLSVKAGPFFFADRHFGEQCRRRDIVFVLRFWAGDLHAELCTFQWNLHRDLVERLIIDSYLRPRRVGNCITYDFE